MKINIQGYRVLLKPDEIKDKIESTLDLVKAEVTKDTELRNMRKATVLQVGADCYGPERTDKPWCKEGDRVLINPQAGFPHEEDGERYLIVNEEDILATIGE